MFTVTYIIIFTLTKCKSNNLRQFASNGGWEIFTEEIDCNTYI